MDGRIRQTLWFLTLAAVLVTLYSSFLLFWVAPDVRNGGFGGTADYQQQAAGSALGELLKGASVGNADWRRRVQEFLFQHRFNTSVFFMQPYTVQSLFRRANVSLSAAQLSRPQDALPYIKTYDYDPRLSMAVYLDYINENWEQIGANEQGSGPQWAVPFNWYDWADLSSLNDFIDLDAEHKVDCDFVTHKFFPTSQLTQLEKKFRHRLFQHDRYKPLGVKAFLQSTSLLDPEDVDPKVEVHEYCVSNNAELSPGFMALKPLNWSRPEVYNLQARSMLYTNEKTQPLSITFMADGSSFQIPVSTNNHLGGEGPGWRPNSLLFNGLLQRFLSKHGSQQFDHLSIWSETRAKIMASSKANSIRKSLPYRLEINESSFEFDAKSKYQELKSNEVSLTAHQKRYMEALERSLNSHYVDLPKHFEEAAKVTDMVHLGHHYDARFFRGGLPNEEVRARLDAIVRAWLRFTSTNNLTTWIAHGTLYGWLYNGLAFTWDGDHDVQMPVLDFNIMAERFNSTIIVEDPTVGNGRFFLDIGTFLTSRIKGNGNNNIDGRFIDVDSGLYVDITALSVSSQPTHPRFDWLINKYHEDMKERPDSMEFYEDPNVVTNITDLTVKELLKHELELNRTSGTMTRERVDFLKRCENEGNFRKDVYRSTSMKDRYNINKHAQLYNCRNQHFQTLWELSPLRLTFFHGVPAYVPNLVIKDLQAEYKVPAENGFQCYENKCYLPELRGWYTADQKKKLSELISSSPDLKQTPFPEDGIQKLSREEFEIMMLAFAKEKSLNDAFSYAIKTFPVTAFRHRELELIYDTNMLGTDKSLMLNEFMQNRRFDPIYKDAVQYRLEFSIWEEFLEKTDIPYTEIEKVSDQLKVDMARKFVSLNERFTNHSISWDTETGYQQPASRLNFDSNGEIFYKLGEKWNNKLFVNDPVDLDGSLADQYHWSEEKKYSVKDSKTT